MSHRKRQSNPDEYCPLCLQHFTARFAAASHYGKHVRAGEMEKRGSGEGAEYRLVTSDVLHSAWWRTGCHVYGFDKTPEHVRFECNAYLVKQWKKEHGLPI